MRNAVLVTMILVLLVAATAVAQEDLFETILKFEDSAPMGTPQNWGGGPMETIHLDTLVVHSGKGAMRLERDAASPKSFTTITKMLPIDFAGQTIELSGYLRTEDVVEYVGLWLRQDGPAGALQFDNMKSRGVKGTLDWTQHTITLPLDPLAEEVYFGFLMAGEGKSWVDDMELLVDGKPLREAPRIERVLTILDTDQEFDVGSKITTTSLSEIQVENVAKLGMVWGFLKYHHPRVTKGEFHWDYELFRALGWVLGAPNKEAGQDVLAQWVSELGVPASCSREPVAPEDPHLQPQLDWIYDTDFLGAFLSEYLQDTHAIRYSEDEQFYLAQVPGVGNPVFNNELAYKGHELPDAGYRLLALFRVWNIIEYWFPYRDLIEDDWQTVLRDFVPRFAAADDWESYGLELYALMATLHDTHAGLYGAPGSRPPYGSCGLPVSLRFIEGRAMVVAYTDQNQRPDTGLEVGDVIETIDGQTVASLIEEMSPYYSASNQPALLRVMAGTLLRGECGEGSLEIERDGKAQTVTVMRKEGSRAQPAPHDLPGETFQLLSDDVAYLKLSSIKIADVPGYIEQAAGTTGLVIDIRNYPSEFVVFALGSQLVQEPTAFAKFTSGDMGNPGAFIWNQTLSISPGSPGYRGKVAILIDDSSISQSEYTAMAMRVGPEAMVIGNTTAGADGNVSQIPLPGGLKTMITGIGVFYPDGTQTQQVGIVPDIFVEPTVEGIRAGRDEVLEEALRQLRGDAADRN